MWPQSNKKIEKKGNKSQKQYGKSRCDVKKKQFLKIESSAFAFVCFEISTLLKL